MFLTRRTEFKGIFCDFLKVTFLITFSFHATVAPIPNTTGIVFVYLQYSTVFSTCTEEFTTATDKKRKGIAFHMGNCDRDNSMLYPRSCGTFGKGRHTTFKSLEIWSASLNTSSVAQERYRWVSLEGWLFPADVPDSSYPSTVHFYGCPAGDAYEVRSWWSFSCCARRQQLWAWSRNREVNNCTWPWKIVVEHSSFQRRLWKAQEHSLKGCGHLE